MEQKRALFVTGRVTNGTGHESAVRLKGRAAKLPGGLLLGSGAKRAERIFPPKPCINQGINNALHAVNAIRVPWERARFLRVLMSEDETERSSSCGLRHL